MTLCPIAIAVGCRKCPAFSVCPVKSVIGDVPKDEPAAPAKAADKTGGKPKQGGITSLEPFFPRIARAYLIGEAAEEFAATLEGKVGFARCGTLDAALAAATRDAAASGAPEPVVLLSPACASYDQYRNFEVRGDAFRTLVAALPGIALRGGG